MAATLVSGKLVNEETEDFSDYRVNADYLMDGVPNRQSTSGALDGTYIIALPEAGAWTGPLSLSVTGLSGTTMGSVEGLSADGPLDNVDIPVEAETGPVVVQ